MRRGLYSTAQQRHKPRQLPGQLVATPHHMLVRAAQHQLVKASLRDMCGLHIQHCQRHVAHLRSSHQRAHVCLHIGPRIKPQQRVARPKGVVQRPPIRQPEVRRAAARHGGRGEAAH